MHHIFKAPAAALALGVGLVAFPIASHAVTTTQTFVQTSDDSSSTAPVGFNTANNVTITDLLNGTLDVKLNLASGWGLVSTGAGGTGGSFSFGLTGISSLTFTAVDPLTFEHTATHPESNTLHPLNTSPSSPVSSISANALSIGASGKYSFTSGYGIEYDSSGGSNPFVGLDFHITNSTTDLTLAAFLAALQSSTAFGTTGLCTGPSSSGCFYADVINGTGQTGLIDFGLRSTEGGGGGNTPLPAAVWLMGSILGGGASVGAWRRRKQRAKTA